MIKIDNEEDTKFLSLEEFKKQTHFKPRPNKEENQNKNEKN